MFPSLVSMALGLRAIVLPDLTRLTKLQELHVSGLKQITDWSALDHPDVDQSRLILAGGINSGNIRQAYESVSPAYVDISSGVETDGVKDRKKIFALTEQMKGVHINGTDLHSAE